PPARIPRARGRGTPAGRRAGDRRCRRRAGARAAPRRRSRALPSHQARRRPSHGPRAAFKVWASGGVAGVSTSGRQQQRACHTAKSTSSLLPRVKRRLVLLPGGDKHSRHIRENRMRRKQL
ncbi:MAG: hypothetical protein E6H77_14860, partial [Betaproteobacteria bacterium]